MAMTHSSLKRPRQLNRNHALLLSILATVLFNTGNAFLPLLPPLHVASAMSTNNSNTGAAAIGANSKPLSAENNENGVEGTPLLGEADPNDSTIPSIKLGESIRFEEMGPVIINADGTTRRIDNWDQMTKNEQEVAWRRISKRNEQRRKALLEQQQQQIKEMEGNEKEEL